VQAARPRARVEPGELPEAREPRPAVRVRLLAEAPRQVERRPAAVEAVVVAAVAWAVEAVVVAEAAWAAVVVAVAVVVEVAVAAVVVVVVAEGGEVVEAEALALLPRRELRPRPHPKSLRARCPNSTWRRSSRSFRLLTGRSSF